MWKELVIGSNRLIDASGVIVVMDKEKVSLERGHDDQLLLTMDVYNADGKHVAKLRRNAWAFWPDPASGSTRYESRAG